MVRHYPVVMIPNEESKKKNIWDYENDNHANWQSKCNHTFEIGKQD